jgi:hypothetical protein
VCTVQLTAHLVTACTDVTPGSYVYVLRTTEIKRAFDWSWWWHAERTNNMGFFHYFIFHYHFIAAWVKNFSTWDGHTYPPITEVQVRPKDDQCWICDRNVILGLVFFPNTEVFFCQHHSTNATNVYFFLYHQHSLVVIRDSIAKYNTKKVGTVGSIGNQQMIQRLLTVVFVTNAWLHDTVW